MSIMLNPPSLWITINPCDLHDPIAQVFAGENINLDNLWEKPGPSKERRIERWWSAQGLACRKEGVGDL